MLEIFCQNDFAVVGAEESRMTGFGLLDHEKVFISCHEERSLIRQPIKMKTHKYFDREAKIEAQ